MRGLVCHTYFDSGQGALLAVHGLDPGRLPLKQRKRDHTANARV